MLQFKNNIFNQLSNLKVNFSFHKLIKSSFYLVFLFGAFVLVHRMNIVAIKVAEQQNPFDSLFSSSSSADDGDDESNTEKIKGSSEQNNLININTATKEELMSLPNIGAKKADEIITIRNAQSFDDITDIMDVKGIGQKTYEQLSNLICT